MGLPKDITATHVGQAIDYIIKHGKPQGKHEIFSVGFAGGGSSLAVVKDDKRIGIREILRVAYCFFKDRKSNENVQFADDQLKLLEGTMRSSASSEMVRDYLIKLKFKVDDCENVLLFNINRSYKMEKNELYEATRGTWKINIKRACTIKYAAAVVEGVIREVYEIDSWQNAGTTKYETRSYLNKKDPKRKEFVGKVANGDIRKLINRKIGSWGQSPFHYEKRDKLIDGVKSESKDSEREEVMESKELKLLKQFKQIILFGPPGTGKTFGAKKLLKELFGVKTDEELRQVQIYTPPGGIGNIHNTHQHCWNIIQFHPSYNYEDFVRGVQVKTTAKGQVAYKTLNKIFGVMCQEAAKEYETAKTEEREPKNYALIIDEINRANVSAVLGELIYALEYRGDKIMTPYKVEEVGQWLTIPKNLYIIGTMNNADRTIGQIDYAVRRRFAFVHCPPKESVIKEQIGKDKANEESIKFFQEVDKIFDEYTSQDFDKKDVRIGHSYFLAKGNELANNIIYQVIPILQEYVKDGVLTSGAKESIYEIEESAKKLLADESENSSSLANKEDKQQHKDEGNFVFFWKTTEAKGFNLMGLTALNIIKHYVKHHKPENLKTLLEGLSLPTNAVISEPKDINKNAHFSKEEEKFFLGDGSPNIVSFQWPNKPKSAKWNKFVNKAKSIGYKISPCHFVNIGQDSRRNWKDCEKYGFVAAGGDEGGQHEKDMKKLKIGSPIFAYLGGIYASEDERGFVAWGWVINEAVPIREFKVEGGKLLSECESVYSKNNGKNYKKQYTESFNNKLCDYAVGINWMEVLSEKDTVKLRWTQHVVREKIEEKKFKELQKAFNLSVEK